MPANVVTSTFVMQAIFEIYLFRTELANQKERFNYTRYQTELLNSIFEKIHYPNLRQKQLIAKRVGINKDQVKVRNS